MGLRRPRPLQPAELLADYLELLTDRPLAGPVLDLACGEGHNGVFAASRGLPVIGCDRSREALDRARALAKAHGASIELRQMDLEVPGVNPLPVDFYGGILVFRYLHRPLMPCIRKAIKRMGFLIYETYTVGQIKCGRPHNPDFLLKPGELRRWFQDWEVIHYFEGVKTRPKRAIAQLVGRKPAKNGHGPPLKA